MLVEKKNAPASSEWDREPKYPELRVHALRIANKAIEEINAAAACTRSTMPYKSQWILEEVIAILKDRV